MNILLRTTYQHVLRTTLRYEQLCWVPFESRFEPMLTATTTTTIHTRRRCDQIYIWSELDLYLPQDRILYDRERKKKYLQNKKKVGLMKL